MNKALLFALSFIVCQNATAQRAPEMCRASELMQAAYTHQPQWRAEREAAESFTAEFLKNLPAQHARTTALDTYRIPVVFHVYGTVQGGKTISDTLIQSAVNALNKDFQGLNADYGQVSTPFLPLRSKLNIRFMLARKDPMGKPTTGIEYLPQASGYGSYGTHDAQIAFDAWDNYRYINVYVMHDIFGNGATNNSGVATFPSVSDNNAGISRIVYNGAFLGSNCIPDYPEFASVLTHEFGHYLNLYHTFEGGCAAPNDYVSDTPPCTTAQGCHSNPNSTLPVNCNGNLVNADNYMDYNICYKMFTKGQRDRMEGALYLTSRITLWQDSNLVFTGIKTATTGTPAVAVPSVRIHPNPSDGQFFIDLPQELAYSLTVSDARGRLVVSRQGEASNRMLRIDLGDQAPGIYFLRLRSGTEAWQFRLQRL